MDDHAPIIEAAYALTTAIARKDAQSVAALLAPDFVLRTPGGAAVPAAEFIASVREIAADIVFVHLEQVVVDVFDQTALVTGVQHARIRVEDDELDELRPFANWFVRDGAGKWRLRLALDLSEAASTVGTAETLDQTRSAEPAVARA
jgi:ketosteroid isomerase-like protein